MPIGSRLHTIVSDLLAPYDPHQLACEIDGGYVLVIDDQFVVNVFEDVAHDRLRFVGGVAAQHDAAHDEDRQSQAQWIKAEAVDAGVELTVGINETGRLVVLGAAADAATLDAVSSTPSAGPRVPHDSVEAILGLQRRLAAGHRRDLRAGAFLFSRVTRARKERHIMQPTHPEPRAGLPLISANALNQTDANKAVPVAAPLGGYGVRRPTPGEMEKNQIVRKAEQELSQSPCNTVADLLQANGRDVAMCLLPLMTKTMPRHCAIDEADGVRFTTFSFAEKPTQSIQVSAPFDLSNGNRPPFADIRKGAVEAGGHWVKVAKIHQLDAPVHRLAAVVYGGRGLLQEW